MEHTVCEHQNKIEVFANEAGGITIRECCFPDEDQTIAIQKDSIKSLIRAIQAAAKDTGA